MAIYFKGKKIVRAYIGNRNCQVLQIFQKQDNNDNIVHNDYSYLVNSHNENIQTSINSGDTQQFQLELGKNSERLRGYNSYTCFLSNVVGSHTIDLKYKTFKGNTAINVEDIKLTL